MVKKSEKNREIINKIGKIELSYRQYVSAPGEGSYGESIIHLSNYRCWLSRLNIGLKVDFLL